MRLLFACLCVVGLSGCSVVGAGVSCTAALVGTEYFHDTPLLDYVAASFDTSRDKDTIYAQPPKGRR